MPALKKISIWFFATGMAGIAVLQFIYNAPRPVTIPLVPAWLGPASVWGWVTGAGMLAAALCIVTGRWARQAALLLGLALLVFSIAFQLPYQLNHYPAHLGVWTNPLKCLCLSGCAFIVSSFFNYKTPPNAFFTAIEKIAPVGIYFFGGMHLLFGIDHFLYPDFCAGLIPAYIPAHMFFSYLAGVALIAAGAGIILNIQRRLAAYLLAAVLLVWVVALHIPRAAANPTADESNEVVSVFEALAFSGVAYLIGTKASLQATQPGRKLPLQPAREGRLSAGG